MRIIAIGDSWTAGHGVETDSLYKEDPAPPTFIQKLREQNSWPRWLADKFGIPYVNLGICGYGNEYIYKDLETAIEQGFITKDDLIIVVFSYPYRYKRHNKCTPLEIFNKFETLLSEYTHYYFNGFFPLLYDESIDIKKLPNNYINPKGTLSYILEVEELQNKENVWEYNSKKVWNDELNYHEGDYHPNLRGYQLIADYIYKEITNAKTK